MSVQNRLFLVAMRSFENVVRLFGHSAYWKVIPRIVETLDVIYDVPVDDKVIKMYCGGEIARTRADRALTAEPDTIEWINSFDPDDVFLDIGANVGVFTLYATHIRGIRTISIEPSASNYFALIRNLRLNNVGHIAYPICAALSDETGVSEILFHDVSTLIGGSGVMTANGDRGSVGWDNTVPMIHGFCIKADDLIETLKLPCPQHLKMDIIGTQKAVVDGAQNLLKDPRLKSAMLEFPDDAIQSEAVNTMMKNCGFIEDDRFKHCRLNFFFKRP